MAILIQYESEGNLTTQASSPVKVLNTHDLSMLNTWSPSGCDSLHILTGLLALLCQYVFEYVENDFVGTIPDAVDILGSQISGPQRFDNERKPLTVLHPSAQNCSTMSLSLAGEVRMMPDVSGLSEYGSRRAAPHDPIAPVQS
jgi:hypothetical protein